MSTNINISVGDNKLLEQARLQQAASRQAQLEKEANQRLEAQATEARTSSLAAQGLDANGESLAGTRNPSASVERRPAATQRSVTPQKVYNLILGLSNPFYDVDTYVFYEDKFVNTSNPSQPEAYANYEFYSKDYIISIPSLNGDQFFSFPLFSVQQDSGVIFYDYREYNSPNDATGTWPSWLSGPEVTSAPLLTDPPNIDVVATASITEKINGETRNITHTTRTLPLKGGEAVILIHCGRWAQVFYSKDVEITWQKSLSQVSGSDPIQYYQNKYVTINKNDYLYGPDYYGSWGKAFLITANNVREISCPVTARVLLEIPEGKFSQSFSTGTGFGNGWNTDQYINGATVPGVPFMRFAGANYTETPLPSNYGGSAHLANWGSGGVDRICYGPTAYKALEKSPQSLPLANDPIWTDAEAVRASIFPDYPIQKYGVKLVPTIETESLPNPNNQQFQWVTTQPPVNSTTAATKIVSRNAPVLDSNARFRMYYRDWNNPAFCKERALALGFSEADLTW